MELLSKKSMLGRTNAAGALRNIAASNQNNKHIIIRTGALQPLVEVASSH